ncbi:unnamed protein product [Sphagnum balticum]
MLDDARSDMKEEMDGLSCSTTPSVSLGSGLRPGEDDTDAYPVLRYLNLAQLCNSPSSHWGVEPDLLPMLHAGDGSLHWPCRDQAENAATLTPMAWMGLVAAARGLYIALGKAMVIPSRWCYDTVALSLAAKMIAGTLAKLLWDNLNFDGDAVLYQSDPAVSVKCQYLGKVVEDLSAVVFDCCGWTCNTLVVNNLAGHGGGLDALVKDSESFICKLHAQVLEVVLPIWNHPGFMHCDVTLINSIASIITHIYMGVGNVNGSRMPEVGGVGLHLIGQPLEESSISMIVEMGFSQEDDELVQALAMSLGTDGVQLAE